jgi:acetolactate synthase-1/2/3 large subunit
VETVAHKILDILANGGADRVFLVPGGACSPVLKALLDRPGFQTITAKQETNAVFLAMGYSFATGKPGIVLTTAGPGITNALTGLASAKHENLPIVHLAGDVPTTAFGRDALQESSPSGLNAISLARGLTKYAVQLTRSDAAPSIMQRALATALSGAPGPVFVSLPLDVAAAQARMSRVAGKVHAHFDIESGACIETAGLLAMAKRPLVIAGAGCRSRASRQALIELAEGFNLPVIVSPKGKGVFPEQHANYLGVFGFGGHESVIEYLEGGVDVLLVCGSGLNDFATNAWSPLLRPTSALVQVDIDAAKLGKNYPADLGLIGPVDLVVQRILANKPEQITKRPAFGRLRHQEVTPSATGRISTVDVMRTLNEHAPNDVVYTVDMGEHLAMALHFLEIGENATFFTALGFGSMGSGPVTAIGYQLGAPKRRVIAICGDGGFLMSGSEVTTAVQHDIACTFLIINDSRLNMCYHGMIDLYGESLDFSTKLVDFATLAQAYGAKGVVIETVAQLREALAQPLDGPLVLDVRVDPEVRLGGSQRNAALRQFKADA